VIGTLVLVIPTRDGIVASADSRGAVRGQFFDGRKKLRAAQTTPPIVFAITGAADFPKEIQPGVPPEDWPYAFRSHETVFSCLVEGREFVLTPGRMHDIGDALALSVGSFLTRSGKLDEFTRRDICRLVLCQSDAATGDSLYGSVAISMGSTGTIGLADARFERYLLDGSGCVERIGEGTYLNEVVLNGPGRQFLSNEALSLLTSPYRIKDVDSRAAAAIATAVIRAAEYTTRLSPIPSGSGIGGPVMCLVLQGSGVSQI